ncbi:hypothetical protein PENSPDRAFT_148306 [Peniophora sp. CONT]|nr:hypothetical protein PENSPDRAFT_148306 [Peniophora sp. CONT]
MLSRNERISETRLEISETFASLGIISLTSFTDCSMVMLHLLTSSARSTMSGFDE